MLLKIQFLENLIKKLHVMSMRILLLLEFQVAHDILRFFNIIDKKYTNKFF